MKTTYAFICFLCLAFQGYSQQEIRLQPGGDLKQTLADLSDDTHLILSEGIYIIPDDGSKGPIIQGLTNVTITGEGDVSIAVQDGYQRVLTIEECVNITLQNILMTHNVMPGDCDAAVVRVSNSSNIFLQNMRLDGSGTMAAEIADSDAVSITGGEAMHNTEGVFAITNANRISISNISIHDNNNVNWGGSSEAYFGMGILNAKQVNDLQFTGNNIFDNQNRYFQKLENCTEVTMEGNSFGQNQFPNPAGGVANDSPSNTAISSTDGTSVRIQAGDDIVQAIKNLSDGQQLLLSEGEYYIPASYPTGVVLEGLSEVGIIGEGYASIIANSGHHRVMTIKGCENILIEGIYMTHNIQQGHCDAPVVSIQGSQGVLLQNNDYNGSGTQAVEMMNATNVEIDGGSAYFNTEGVFWIEETNTARIHDMFIYGNSNSNWGERVEEAQAPFGYGILNINNSLGISFTNNELLGNENSYFKRIIESEDITIIDNISEGNLFNPTHDLPTTNSLHCFFLNEIDFTTQISIKVNHSDNSVTGEITETGGGADFDGTFGFSGRLEGAALSIEYQQGGEIIERNFTFRYYALSEDDIIYEMIFCED